MKLKLHKEKSIEELYFQNHWLKVGDKKKFYVFSDKFG